MGIAVPSSPSQTFPSLSWAVFGFHVGVELGILQRHERASIFMYLMRNGCHLARAVDMFKISPAGLTWGFGLKLSAMEEHPQNQGGQTLLTCVVRNQPTCRTRCLGFCHGASIRGLQAVSGEPIVKLSNQLSGRFQLTLSWPVKWYFFFHTVVSQNKI